MGVRHSVPSRLVLFFRRPKVEKVMKSLVSVFKYSFFAFFMFLMYMPIFIIAIQSFNDRGLLYRFSGFTFDYWINVLTFNLDPDLMAAIITTLLVAFIATLISTVVGTIAAIGIHALPKKKRQQMVILNQVPILNADIITGLSLMFIFKIVVDLFPNIFGLPSLIVAHVFFCIPYVVLSIMPKLAELDENLYDAALDLYCKPKRAITRVIIPAIMPGIFTGMLIAFTMSIDDFLISFFNTGSYDPFNAGLGLNNISTYIYGSVNRQMAPEVYAYNTILSLGVILILAFVYIRSAYKNRKHEQKI